MAGSEHAAPEARRETLLRFAAAYPAQIVGEPGKEILSCLAFPDLSFSASNLGDALVRLRTLIADRLKQDCAAGRRVPWPHTDETRTAQVNVRLTPAEKQIVEQFMGAGGYTSISEFMRDATYAALIHLIISGQSERQPTSTRPPSGKQ